MPLPLLLLSFPFLPPNPALHVSFCMSTVLIPSAIQTVSRSFGTSLEKEISTNNVSSPETPVSCSYRMALSNNSVTQTESMSRFSESSSLQSDTERQEQGASAKNSTLSGSSIFSTQPLLPVSMSAPTVLSSRLGQASTPRDQQAAPFVQMDESLQATIQHTVLPSQQFVQNVQHSALVAQFGPKLVTPPFPQNQNPITESCPSGQSLQTMVTVTDKRFSGSKPVTSLTESSTRAPKPSVFHPQTAAQIMTQLGHFPNPRTQAPSTAGQHTVAQGHVSTSASQISPPQNQIPIPPTQVSVQPIHLSNAATHAPPEVLIQSNDILSPNLQNVNLQGHLPSVAHHDLTSLTQPFYPLTHTSFAPPFIPLQSIKPSVPSSSISQTSVSSPLVHATSHYDILSDPLCSSSDQFFSTPDNTTDLLQPLPSMPFHSPVVLNQQETTSMIHSQSSGQPLQLAPLLTLKEQQAAASNHGNVSKRGPSISAEIPMSTVNNFEEHMQRYPPLASHESTNCESEAVMVEMPNENPTENKEGSRPGVIPGPIQHYTVLSKPGPNFIVPDSTKEQQTFRMNMAKDLQTDNDISKQKEGCDTTCQVWEPSDFSSVLPESALGAPAHTILQKPARKVLEKKTECPECGRILSNASSLENHMRLHRGERPYTCSQCGKAFPSVRGLNRHVKVHAEEKGYKCEECGRSFVYQFTLTKHKLIHSGDRPFPCKVCGKKFLAKADRVTHMRMHTGEKPFFCNQCGKTFKHRVALNMHMQGHRGEKRYVCPHCEKGFVDLGNFKRHKRIHTGEKPFECKECGKRFTQSAHLKKHINTQHVAVKPK